MPRTDPPKSSLRPTTRDPVKIRIGRSVRRSTSVRTELGTVTDTLRWLDEQEAASPWRGKLRRQMLKDPAVKASLEFLVLAALSATPRVQPARQADPGLTPDDLAGPERALVEEAAEVAAFVQRAIDNLRRPLKETLREFARDAMAHRSKLAVIVYKEGTGEDRHRWVWDRFAVKPLDAWQFMVDDTMHVIGIEVTTDDGPQILDRRSFWIATWDEQDGDPRGTSILEAAEVAWSMRIQGNPGYFRFVQRFATPKIVGKTAPGAVPDVVGTDPETKAEITEEPEIRLADDLAGFAAGDQVLAVPNGTEVETFEPKNTSSGDAWQGFFDFTRLEIFLSIVLATRVLAESRHGSKADSGTAQDVSGNLVRYIGDWITAGFTWDAIYELVVLNFGREVADRSCPSLVAPQAEHQDLAGLLTAFGKIGLEIVPEQVPALFGMLGLPIPSLAQVRASQSGNGGRKTPTSRGV